jgi:hypothetical protein
MTSLLTAHSQRDIKESRMENQLPNVVDIGEMGLFLIGVIASLILLFTLLLPTLSRVRVPGWLWVGGISQEDLMSYLSAVLPRDGYELREVGARHLTFLSDSVTYTLHVEPIPSDEPSDDLLCVRLESDGVDLSRAEPLNILSSAGVGWLTLRLHHHLQRLSARRGEPLSLSWSFSQARSEALERPLTRSARYVVTIAPWR